MPGRRIARIVESVWGADISSLADHALVDSIGAFFGHDFSAVRFRRGGILPRVVPFPYSAVVFGNTVNIRRGYESVLHDPRVMAEELFHVIQWTRLGPLRMAIVYPFFHLVRGYAGNPIEREAKQRADAYCSYCSSGSYRVSQKAVFGHQTGSGRKR